jgi:hypothetical protein
LPSPSSEERELYTSACAADIRELCVQFRQAIVALASDDLAAIETSTEIQESLVGKLQDRFRGDASEQRPAIKVSASDVKALANLTRIYSSLLQRALRTVRLRASLCRTYKQSFPSAPEAVAASGWSCEV